MSRYPRLSTVSCVANCVALGTVMLSLGALLLVVPARPAFAEDELRQLAEPPACADDRR